jgi:hypothetical protein
MSDFNIQRLITYREYLLRRIKVVKSISEARDMSISISFALIRPVYSTTHLAFYESEIPQEFRDFISKYLNGLESEAQRITEKINEAGT